MSEDRLQEIERLLAEQGLGVVYGNGPDQSAKWEAHSFFADPNRWPVPGMPVGYGGTKLEAAEDLLAYLKSRRGDFTS